MITDIENELSDYQEGTDEYNEKFIEKAYSLANDGAISSETLKNIGLNDFNKLNPNIVRLDKNEKALNILEKANTANKDRDLKLITQPISRQETEFTTQKNFWATRKNTQAPIFSCTNGTVRQKKSVGARVLLTTSLRKTRQQTKLQVGTRILQTLIGRLTLIMPQKQQMHSLSRKMQKQATSLCSTTIKIIQWTTSHWLSQLMAIRL